MLDEVDLVANLPFVLKCSNTMKEKGNTSLFLLIVIAVAVTTSLFVSIDSNKTNIQPKMGREKKDVSETLNWKTYTNTVYNYTIHYPNNWINNFYGTPDNQPVHFGLLKENGLPEYDLTITPRNNPRNLYDQVLFNSIGSSCVGNCPETGENSKKEGIDYYYISPQVETKVVNGNTLYELKGSEKGSQRGSRYAIIPIPQRDLYLLVHINSWPEEESTEVFDKMLSTFKFTNGS